MYYVCFYISKVFPFLSLIFCQSPPPLLSQYTTTIHTITRISTSTHYYCIIISSPFINYTNLLQLNIILGVFSSATPEPRVHLTTAFFFFLPAPPPSAQYNPSIQVHQLAYMHPHQVVHWRMLIQN